MQNEASFKTITVTVAEWMTTENKHANTEGVGGISGRTGAV